MFSINKNIELNRPFQTKG